MIAGDPQGREHEVVKVLEILELAQFRVYVADVLSHELVYSNNSRQPQSPGAKAKCYQAIYHEDHPCMSCNFAQLMDADGRPNGRIVTCERFDEAEDQWYQLREGTIRLSDGRVGMYSIAIDIGEIKEIQNRLAEAHAELAFKNQQLENLSVTDRLTGLFNRRKLDEVLSQECLRAQRTASPLTVIIADIDKFKSVNDLHGHLVGDQLLVELAVALQHGVRKVDIVGRWGGEEFMIICPDTDLAGACVLAENIRIAINGRVFPVVGRKTCCFGVAQYRPGEAPEAVVKRADDALYRAKKGGRNQVQSG